MSLVEARSVRVTRPAEAVKEQCTRQARIVRDERRTAREHSLQVERGWRIVEMLAHRENRDRDRTATRERDTAERARLRKYDADVRRIQREDKRAAERRTVGTADWLADE
jgi:hypothetical protein